VADGVREIRAVERVEMELADAFGEKLSALLGGHRGRDELARAGSPSSPSNNPASQSGKPAPHARANWTTRE